jgi:zinc transport system ATP-binding protein
MLKCQCEGQPQCTCATSVVCLKNVSFNRGDKNVLDDITFCIDEGIFLGIIGPNGGGKTTLLKLILGSLPLQAGKIQIFGYSPRELGSKRSLIGYVPQKHEIDKNFPATALDVVLMGAVAKVGLFRRVPAELKGRAEELLTRVGVGDLSTRLIGRMSGGQQQRTFIARALISQPKLLILDEPTVGLDSAGQKSFLELVCTLKKELHLTVVMVSHDVGQLSFYSDQIACLNRRLHWHNRSELLDEQTLHHVYTCEMDAYRDRVSHLSASH